MVVKKNSSVSVKKKSLSLKNVPVPLKKQKIRFPELFFLKKNEPPLKSMPIPSKSLQQNQPFDLVSEEHGLFRRWDLFRLGSRKVFPFMHEKVAVTEELVEEIAPFTSPPKEKSLPLSLGQNKTLILPVHEQILLPDLAPEPWQKTLELLFECRSALQKEKLDYAQIFYEELKPFYSKLTSAQQEFVTRVVLDLAQDLEMLKLQKLKERLKRGY